MAKLMLAAVALWASAALADAPKETSYKGEIVDTICYLTKGAHGAAHKDCAAACLKNGNPAALLSDGKLYILLAAHGNEAAMDQVKAHAAEVVTVTGTEVDMDGLKAIFVTAVK